VTGPSEAGRPKAIFIGSGAFGVESLHRLHGAPEVSLVAVVTAPARPAGRGGRLTPTPVESAARSAGVGRILAPPRLRSDAAIAEILSLEPELIVLADYGRLVPARLLEVPLGALNLHPSLLPRHRGATPIAATILAGDEETGVTLMEMDEGLDTGPIVAQSRVALSGRETAPELEGTLSREAEQLLGRSLGPWVRSELPAIPQPADGATLTRPLTRGDGLLDPHRPAAALERQVRAYQPWPGSYLDTPAGRLIVLAASVAAGPARSPGNLETEPDLRLATSDGWLVLDEVKPAGGRPMSGESFVRGRRATFT
jgi:methionyl-tRNA formyltransferase